MSEENTVLVWLLIEEDDSVLVGKRKHDEPPFSGDWVLPGDELPRGQAASSFIALYGKDQLDIQVMGDEPFETLYLKDGEETYAIAVHRVGFEGTPRFRESGPYSEVGWAPRGELMDATAFPQLSELAGHLTRTM